MSTNYHIETQGGNTDDPVPDYYPLTTEEVIELLNTAKTIKSKLQNEEYPGQNGSQEIASIQMRLLQGIPGSYTPGPIDGPVVEKQIALEKAFVDWITDPMMLQQQYKLTEYDSIVLRLMELLRDH